MTNRLTLNVWEPQQAYQSITGKLWPAVKNWTLAGHRLVILVKNPTRSVEQNRILWSILTDLSEQCLWAVDGAMVKLPPEDVKHILTAGLKRHQRMARGIDGGVVILGQSTSSMSVAEMSELITLGHAYGDQQGVQWSRTSLGRDWPDMEAA